MINNAKEARDLSDNSADPKLEGTLELIEEAAAMGLYSVCLGPLRERLINNLKARGFAVFNGDSVSW